MRFGCWTDAYGAWWQVRPSPDASTGKGCKGKDPKGTGRGNDPNHKAIPDASKGKDHEGKTGKGCKGAKAGKGGTEAPAGKGRGVGPSPYASKGKDPHASTGKGAKDRKGREKKKRSEKTDAERLEDSKRHRAQVLARRTSANCRPKWNDSFRTPLGHRFGHKRPKDCSRATAAFPTILRKAGLETGRAQTIFNNVYDKFDAANRICVKRCREWVQEWLQARHFGDARQIRNIHKQEAKRELCKTEMWPGGPTFESFTGNSACDLPLVRDDCYMEVDFYFNDFDPNMWDVFNGIKDKKKCWLQWHGTNFYSFSTILALNYLGVSKSEKKGPRNGTRAWHLHDPFL